MAIIAVTINVNANPHPEPYGVEGSTGTYLANAPEQRINRSTTLIGSYPTNYYIYYRVRSTKVTATSQLLNFFRYNNSDIGNIVSFSYNNGL